MKQYSFVSTFTKIFLQKDKDRPVYRIIVLVHNDDHLLGHPLCHVLCFHSQAVTHSITNNRSYPFTIDSYSKTIASYHSYRSYIGRSTQRTTTINPWTDIKFLKISLLFHTSTYMILKCHTEIISNTSPRFLKKFTIHASLLKLVTSTFIRLKCHTNNF